MSTDGQQAIPKFNGMNVPIPVVAKAMKKDAGFIRIGLQKGFLPIGTAYKTSEGNEHFDYYISPLQLFQYTGYIYEEALIKEGEGT